MKGCLQWKPFTVENISPQAGLGTARSVGQRLTTELLVLPIIRGVLVDVTLNKRTS